MRTKIFICSIGLLLLMCSSTLAKQWRGIIPLHSTCDDVKRILGITECRSATYYFEHENAFIHFSDSTNSGCGGNQLSRWNVPVGTVLQINVWPKVKPKLSDLHIDESKFKKEQDPELPEFYAYTNYEEGFSFVVSPGGEADNFLYFGTPKDGILRCPNHKPRARRKRSEATRAQPRRRRG